MSESTTGARAILQVPLLYDGLQWVLGSARARRIFVREYLRPKQGTRLLDWGCGTADLLRYLPKGVDYVGLDASERYLDEARRRFGSRGEFIRARDKARVEEYGRFDVVLATGLLHHLDCGEAIDLVGSVRRGLVEDGRFLTIDPCYADGQSRTARFLIDRDRGQNVRGVQGYSELVRPVFRDVETWLRHDLLRVPYTHLIMECRA